MNRKGHIGMALLAFAPVAYILISKGQFALAVLGWLGVQSVEPLPDQDFHLPFLTHRGLSHSLLAALVVGGVLGAVGWFFGGNLFDLLLTALLAGANGFGWVLGLLPKTLADMINLLLPNVSLEALVSNARQLAGESVNQWTFAAYGLFVGAYGILAHLLGDVITDMGIKPLLPFSRWQLSLSPLHADNSFANRGLFALGVLAVVVVLGATVPGVALGAASADLSPVGVAAGQTANQTANQSTNQSQTQSRAAVVFKNQTTNGSTVTIERVTLPDNGFVAIHTSEYLAGPAPAEYSVIAVSDHLPAGTHRNITIDISHAPPRNPPGLNRSKLNHSQTLSAVVYRDADDDHQFDFVRTYGENDSAVRENDSIVADSARVRVPEPEPTTASAVFRNQTLRNDTLTVAQVRLPRGGFVVAHNASYRRTGDAVTSVVGSSRYLPPGNYSNVSVRVLPGTLNETQVVTVRPSLDTNGNQQYDFVQSGGFRDVAYEDRTGNQSRVVTETALVRVPGSGQQVTDSRTRTQTATANAPGTTKTPSAPASRADRGEGGLFGLGVIPTIVGILVVLVVLPSVIRKFF